MDRESTEIDDVYSFFVTFDVITNSEYEPQSVEECRQRDEWPNCKIAIPKELQSLRKKNVFRLVVQHQMV